MQIELIRSMEFHNQIFALVAIPALIAAVIGYRMRTHGRLRFSSIKNLSSLPSQRRLRKAKLVRLLRFLSLLLLFIAVAGPRLGVSGTKKFRYGADIIIVVDISTSMGQPDYRRGRQFITRLDGTREVLDHFLDERENNRVGIVTFAKDARTLCPLTLDYNMLRQTAQGIDLVKTEEEDGTAIGMAIANAVNRLRKSTVHSKIIILMTDGENNWGWISPENAAQLARAEGINVFCIGTASLRENFDTRVDDRLLRKISTMTRGRYFRAKDVFELKKVYAKIDEMKETEIDTAGYRQYRELSPIFILAVFGLVFIEMILKNTLFLTIP